MINLKESIDIISSFTDSAEIISIIVGKSGHNQLHCGIAFKNKGRFNALHLAWHFLLKHEKEILPEFEKYIYIKSSIPEIRQLSISAMCRRIIKRHSEKLIPYGLKYNGGSFTREGILKLNETENGLTCATFILALFKSCDIQLIDIKNWKSRPEDLIWHYEVIKVLEQTKVKYNISQQHIENIKKEIGGYRFRPEEVAISSGFNITPSTFESIINQGEVIKSLLLN